MQQQHPPKASHHGRTPAAWTSTTLALIAFVIGAIAMVMGPNWTMFWVAAGLLVLSVVVGWGMSIAGLGEHHGGRHLDRSQLPSPDSSLSSSHS